MTPDCLNANDSEPELKIISIDGGPGAHIGLRMLLQIERWRADRGQPSVLKQADMLSGTSDGGLLALFLARRLQEQVDPLQALEECIEFHRECLATVTLGPMDVLRVLRVATRPVYDGIALREVYSSAFGELTLGDVKHRRPLFGVMAFDVKRWEPISFSNFPPNANDHVSLVDIAMATGSSPVLMPLQVLCVNTMRDEQRWNEQSKEELHPFIDGFAANNNPTWSAINHALTYLAHNDPNSNGTYFIDNYSRVGRLKLLSLGARSIERTLPWEEHEPEWLSDGHPTLARIYRLRRALCGDDDPLTPGSSAWGMGQWLVRTLGFGFLNLCIQGASAMEHQSARTLLGVKKYHRFHPQIPLWDILWTAFFGSPGELDELVEERTREVWRLELEKLVKIEAFMKLCSDLRKKGTMNAQELGQVLPLVDELTLKYEVPIYFSFEEGSPPGSFEWKCSIEEWDSTLRWVDEYWSAAAPS
jgi:hypothetical protein